MNGHKIEKVGENIVVSFGGGKCLKGLGHDNRTPQSWPDELIFISVFVCC